MKLSSLTRFRQVDETRNRVWALSYSLCCYDVPVLIERMTLADENALLCGVELLSDPCLQLSDVDDISLNQAIPVLQCWRGPGEGEGGGGV